MVLSIQTVLVFLFHLIRRLLTLQSSWTVSSLNFETPVVSDILQQNGWGPAREFGNLGNSGSKKISKIKTLKIKIRVAQNVGKVQISRKKTAPGPIWGHPWPFFAWAGKIEKMQKFCLFSLVGQWALFTWFGEIVAIFLLPSVLFHQTEVVLEL